MDIKMEQESNNSFILSLLGGIIIIAQGVVEVVSSPFLMEWIKRYRITRGISLGGQWGMMLLMTHGIMLAVLGILVIIGALLIRKGEKNYLVGSIVIIVASAASLSLGGGFFIGFALALIGGIIALSYRKN